MIYITVTPQEFRGSIAPRGTTGHGTGTAPHQREAHVSVYWEVVCAHNNTLVSHPIRPNLG
jgi:hypothetical protein